MAAGKSGIGQLVSALAIGVAVGLAVGVAVAVAEGREEERRPHLLDRLGRDSTAGWRGRLLAWLLMGERLWQGFARRWKEAVNAGKEEKSRAEVEIRQRYREHIKPGRNRR